MSEPQNSLPALGVRRPWLVTVLNLLIVIAGVAALFGVEVRELPDVDRPIVSVRAVYPGASPETMDAEVTSLIEGAVARVSGVSTLESSSEENSARIRVEFQPGFDLDAAAADVREAVSRIERELPDGLEQLTVYKADQDAEPIVVLAASSDLYTEEALTRIVEQDIIPELISIAGVADVPLFGQRQRFLRVAVDPLRLTSFGLSISDLTLVLREAALDVPVGSFRSLDQDLLVRADASAVTEEAIADLVIKDGIRVADIASVLFAPEDAQSFSRLNGRRVVGLEVVRQAGSNTIEISAGVEQAMERLNQRLDGVQITKISDNAEFISGSVQEVVRSLALATMVVCSVIWLFSGSLRITLVPSLAIPIALLGTLAVVWVLGFSINILTLLALVLATGLIVDDAIIVLENVQRRRQEGLGAKAAAVLGTQQVFFAVIATTAVLIAAFVPIAFLPGTAGRLFQEFGIVLAVAVTISSFVALSLVPASLAGFADGGAAKVDRPFARIGRRFTGYYKKSLKTALRFPLVTTSLAIALALGAVALYPVLGQELLPDEDRGVLYVNASGPDGVGLAYTERQGDRIEDVLQPLLDSGEVAALYTIIGRYDPNRVQVLVRLAPWSERQRSQQAIAAEIQPILSRIPGASVRVSSPNSLGLRGEGGLEVALTGTDYPEIFAAARELADAIETEAPNLIAPRISYQPTQPQLSLEVDRRRATDLGVPLTDLASTLRVMIDGLEVVDLNVGDDAIPIFLEAPRASINEPADLANLFVRSGDANLIPLSSLVSLKEEGVAAELDRHAQRRGIEIDADVRAGYPLQSAVNDVRVLADRLLPQGIGFIPLGAAATLEETNRDALLTYAFALLIVLLVLIAQFESITSALVVMLIVPFGLAAALFALYITGTTLNVYSQVGLIMLIGLMAKNGIILVEFADQLRDGGASVAQAIQEAARVRLRPIVMTLVSTVFGALPLILSTGPGAEARHAIGWVVFAGLGLAAVFTLYLTPLAYRYIAPWSKPRGDAAASLERELRG
ncbi:MAG: efflux RND transporter permease subunit [Pseudomonadaceae bacterium]|nr:efflux RND transporter permease subunit [Pseudomonadaceae bacterium]